MPARNYLLLFILAACAIAAVASIQKAPGYMDAEYYAAGGAQLAAGRGFEENFLWNYLDAPSGLPHPSHLYWMPLASMLAALIPWIAGGGAFPLARVPFILIGAGIAPLTAGVAYRLSRSEKAGCFAGVLAAFPGFYLAYFPTTDTFGLYMLLGTVFLLLAANLPRMRPEGYPKLLLLGVCAGLMHASRADGLLWLVFAVGIVLWAIAGELRILNNPGDSLGSSPRYRGLVLTGAFFCPIVGYLVVMAPWWLRNLSLFGTLFVPGTSRVVWERTYNELFNLYTSTLSFVTWWSQGFWTILGQRLAALGANLKTALGVQMEIVLLPFALVGLWVKRRDRLVRLAGLAWLVTLGVMSFVYPFAGSRGGFLHSGTVAQPVIWAVVPTGFDRIIRWAAAKRGWAAGQAASFFTYGLIAIVILLTGSINYRLVVGGNLTNPIWNQSQANYREVEQALQAVDPLGNMGVMVNNPAGYSLVADRPAYVIPNGDVQVLLTAANKYHAGYVVIDPNLPAPLLSLYQHPDQDRALTIFKRVDQFIILKIAP